MSSPMDQFQIICVIRLPLINLISIIVTNFLLIEMIALLFLLVFFYTGFTNNNNKIEFFLIPDRWQGFFELVSDNVCILIFGYLKKMGQSYVFVISTIFVFVFVSNLIGMVPYSFTATSHLIITLALSFCIFIGVNLIAYFKHGINVLSLFLPPKTTFLLAWVLVPIEIVSFLAKPISLGVRLFINMMAGHTLLKVIGGFTFNAYEADYSTLSILPVIMLIILLLLELAVAAIQTYVFTVLSCLYIKDALELH